MRACQRLLFLFSCLFLYYRPRCGHAMDWMPTGDEKMNEVPIFAKGRVHTKYKRDETRFWSKTIYRSISEQYSNIVRLKKGFIKREKTKKIGAYNTKTHSRTRFSSCAGIYTRIPSAFLLLFFSYFTVFLSVDPENKSSADDVPQRTFQANPGTYECHVTFGRGADDTRESRDPEAALSKSRQATLTDLHLWHLAWYWIRVHAEGWSSPRVQVQYRLRVWAQTMAIWNNSS